MECSQKINRSFSAIIFLSVLLGIALRWTGQLSDLWLDEIWLLRDVGDFHSIWDYFSLAFAQGQPSLYTSFAYLLKDSEPEWFIRLPSFFFAVGTIVAVIVLSRCYRFGDKVIAPIVVSVNFVLVLYGSEARGYSGLIFFSLLALIVLIRGLNQFQIKWLVLFWAFCALGYLFHPTFLQFYIGLLLYSASRIYAALGFWKGSVRNILWHYPALAFFWLWSVKFLSHLPGLSGPRAVYLDTIISALSVFFGGPEVSSLDPRQTLVAFFIGLLIPILLMVELVRLRKGGNDSWLLYLGAIFLGPALMLITIRPEVLLPRYFIGALVPALLLFSEVCAAKIFKKADHKTFGCFLVVLYLGGQLRLLSQFIHYGRGQYRAGLEYIGASTNTSEISVSSNQDFRNKMLIDYYGRKVVGAKHFNYIPAAKKDDAEWFILHTQDQGFTPSTQIEPNFKLVTEFQSAPLSGWRWIIYHQELLAR